jgi:hypothetical protein|tara:strand:- start:6501 stop:6995 length:495 start_codon:yes stop_codon:yes gene_type:complete
MRYEPGATTYTYNENVFTMNNNKLSFFPTAQLLLKTGTVTLTLLVSGVTHADKLSVAQQEKSQSGDAMGTPSTVACPSEFHSIVLSSDATQCQQFESKIPAAMVYHTAMSPSQVISFYKEQLPMFKTHPVVNQRTLITSKERHTKIVVSPDNKGAQVDILVIAK